MGGVSACLVSERQARLQTQASQRRLRQVTAPQIPGGGGRQRPGGDGLGRLATAWRDRLSGGEVWGRVWGRGAPLQLSAELERQVAAEVCGWTGSHLHFQTVSVVAGALSGVPASTHSMPAAPFPHS